MAGPSISESEETESTLFGDLLLVLRSRLLLLLLSQLGLLRPLPPCLSLLELLLCFLSLLLLRLCPRFLPLNGLILRLLPLGLGLRLLGLGLRLLLGLGLFLLPNGLLLRLFPGLLLLDLLTGLNLLLNGGSILSRLKVLVITGLIGLGPAEFLLGLFDLRRKLGDCLLGLGDLRRGLGDLLRGLGDLRRGLGDLLLLDSLSGLLPFPPALEILLVQLGLLLFCCLPFLSTERSGLLLMLRLPLSQPGLLSLSILDLRLIVIGGKLNIGGGVPSSLIGEQSLCSLLSSVFLS